MLDQVPAPLLYVFLFVFGLAIGSFLNVCIFRLPREKSIVRPRSFCPKCRDNINWYDNIPLVSYILLRGRCRKCGRRISPRYPIVELMSGFFSVLVYHYFGEWLPYLFYYLLLVCPLIVVTFVDLEHQIIPDVITLPGIAIGVLSRFIMMHGDWKGISADILAGVLIGGGFLAAVGFGYEWLKKHEGLGGGDVKLAAMFGAFFGWKGAIFILVASSIIGSLTGIILMLVFKKGAKHAIPFGPFLALGAVIYLFWGSQILSWYLSLF